MKTFLKWTGIVLGSLLVLAIIGGFALYTKGSRSIQAAHAVEVAALTVPTDSASLARGAHLAGVFGCVDCHGDDLAGQEMGDAPPFRLVASNLTPGGIGREYTPADWDRAIRHGVGQDGRAARDPGRPQ